MLPIRCIQPPCMNIEVSTVYQPPPPSRTQALSGPRGKLVPGATVPSTSPGMNPSRHTDADNAGSLPKPCSRNQASAFAPIRPYVAYGVVKCGLSSRIGNTRPLY